MANSGGSEYLFYEYGGPTSRGTGEEDSGDLKVRVFSPSWNSLRINRFTSIWLYLFWYWFSSRKYLLYYVSDQDEIIHISHVLSKTPKFAFMDKLDMEIGPCWTHPDHRGRGIYSRVLKKVANDLGSQAGRLFIFAQKENSASLKGIAKAGFAYFGSGEKTKPWGVYKITKRVSPEFDG